jgi:hypothetical protein
MNLPPPNVCRRIRGLHGLIGSSNAKEAENARDKLNKLLAKHHLTWNDLPAIFAATGLVNGTSTSTTASRPPTSGPTVNVLDLVLALIEDHIAITPEECMAIALWVLHTYVFYRFAITPRLALLSPVRGCGKTTLLVLLELLVAEPYRTDNVSAAAIYHLLDGRSGPTLLIDEGDNLDLFRNRVLCSIFNSGHRRGGTISRFVAGWSQPFPTFAPLVIAAIGALPLPLMHRAMVINMRRHAAGETEIRRLDEADPAFAAARTEIGKWAATCSLAYDPEMPSLLRNRAADNWRVLLAIADDLGRGEAARSAATALCSNHSDEDPGIMLLTDIRTVFLRRGSDRIASAFLVQALLEFDDGLWNEWRGPRDDRPPRKLTQGELARLLRTFGIRPRTIWPKQRRPGDKSARGYLRSQFESAWHAYCPSSADTPTKSGKIQYLARL